MMKRRKFIAGAAAIFGTAAGSKVLGETSPADNRKKLERVCVSSWSFHNLFTSTHDERAPAISGKPLDILDFPEMVADRYHVHNIEVVSPHFASTETSYLDGFKRRLARAHSRLVNIPVDYDELWDQPALSATDPKEREKAVGLYSKWIDIAKELAAPSIRCDPGKVNPDDLSPTIGSYKTLVSRARPQGIHIIVENHGGIVSKQPELLVKILKESGAGALPDFGNFPDEETREHGLRLLFPLAASICHAKLRQGKMDFGRCVGISKETGFKGVYSIEAGGQGDPYEAVQQVRDELIKYL
jgi:sugar phosphate isomerase/epimerase